MIWYAWFHQRIRRSICFQANSSPTCLPSSRTNRGVSPEGNPAMIERTLPVAPLTAQIFAPYGDVLEVLGEPTKMINQGMCGRHIPGPVDQYASRRLARRVGPARSARSVCSGRPYRQRPQSRRALVRNTLRGEAPRELTSATGQHRPARRARATWPRQITPCVASLHWRADRRATFKRRLNRSWRRPSRRVPLCSAIRAR